MGATGKPNGGGSLSDVAKMLERFLFLQAHVPFPMAELCRFPPGSREGKRLTQ